MLKATLLSLAAAAALATTLLAADETSTPGMMRSDMRAMASKVTGNDELMNDATSSDPDRHFAAVMISHARLQHQIADLVSQKATNDDIKKYAKQMSDEADQISQKITQACQKEGMTLQQDKLLPSDQAMLDFAKQLPASTLQRHYIFHQAGATQTHMLMAQWAAKNATKPEIKQVASNMATKLETRHATAEKLAQAEITGTGRMANE